MQADQGLGQVGEVLDVADDALGEQHQRTGRGPRRGPAGASTARSTNHRATVSADHDPGEVRVQLGDVLPVQRRSAVTSLESPGVRTGPGDHGADQRSAARSRRPAAHGSWRTGVPTSGRGAASPSRVRCQVTIATVISAVASRKCAATMYGLSPVSTVMPPRTALPITIQNWAQPSRVRRAARRGCGARAAMIAQPTAAHSTYVSMRLPNSMAPWMPISRVRGQAVVGARGPGRAAEARSRSAGPRRR